MAEESEDLAEDQTIYVDVPPVQVELDDTWHNVTSFDAEDKALEFAKLNYGAELGYVSLLSPAYEVFILDQQQGKAVQEILRRYVGEELEPRVDRASAFYLSDPDAIASVQKDIDYIEELAKLFD